MSDTVEKKRNGDVDSMGILTLFRRNQADFICRYGTADETRIHHYTPVKTTGFFGPSGFRKGIFALSVLII